MKKEGQSGILAQVEAYYSQKVSVHGATPAGVDWNGAEGQRLRFAQLARLLPAAPSSITVNDLGCGYGALLPYLSEHGYTGRYTGYDISERMIDTARAQAPQSQAGLQSDFLVGDQPSLAEYTIASGIFNVKGARSDSEWNEYLLDVLTGMERCSTKGFAFNVLTSYSDRERMKDTLHYADPCFLFDHCKRCFSRDVALLHDYGLYEFTILVRK